MMHHDRRRSRMLSTSGTADAGDAEIDWESFVEVRFVSLFFPFLLDSFALRLFIRLRLRSNIALSTCLLFYLRISTFFIHTVQPVAFVARFCIPTLSLHISSLSLSCTMHWPHFLSPASFSVLSCRFSYNFTNVLHLLLQNEIALDIFTFVSLQRRVFPCLCDLTC